MLWKYYLEIVFSYNFNFCRNATLAANGAKPPKATSTGTTIVGVVYKVQYANIS